MMRQTSGDSNPANCSANADKMEEMTGTHWSLVLAAADLQSPESSQALARLCQTYWSPLFAFARRRGSSVQEAEDLTQEFIARLLSQNSLAAATPERGQFRSFLFRSFQNFLHNEYDRTQAAKRGGGQRLLSLHDADLHSLRAWEPVAPTTPQTAFDREWAESVLAAVFSSLRREYANADKEQLFDELKQVLVDDQGPGRYAEAARTLEMSPVAVRVATHRLRKRYAALLRLEIGRTVSSPAEIEEELRELFAAFED